MERPGTSAATRLAAAIALVVLTGVWAWWGAKEGAYFGSVMYPGIVVLCVGFALVSSRAALGAGIRLSTPARVALFGLVGLAVWTAASALWSPSPDVAVADAQRAAGYALAFGLGLWLSALLVDRVHLALAPLAVAGLFVGCITLVALLTGDDFDRYVDNGTLQYPLGYRNANSAFFLIALWPTVGLAARRELDWRIRAIALAAATLSLELAALSQSRGSMIAVAVALAVYLAVSRDRAREFGWLALAALPALIVIPSLTDLYATNTIGRYTPVDEVRGIGRAALGGALVALGIGAIAALLERRHPISPERLARANRAVAVGVAGLVVVGAIGFAVVTKDPVGWVEDRVDEFLTQGTPNPSEISNRFSAGAGSERDDLWRVALRSFEDEPLHGLGAGGYQYNYLLERSEEGTESVRDAHSVEFEILAELGFIGLILFALAVGAAVVGAWRSRGRGPAWAALSTCALAAGAYWLAHASLDWFWAYPAVTAPVFALLGSACAAPATTTEDPPGPGLRRLGVAALAVLAVSVVPPYLSERYIDSAYDGWRADLERAQEDLDRARALNPLSIEPLLAEGGIARAAGEPEQAIAAFEEAARERPEEWASFYFLAVLHRGTDPERAREELDRAQALNPHSNSIAFLGSKLRQDAAGAE